jgi:hypothetical protein
VRPESTHIDPERDSDRRRRVGIWLYLAATFGFMAILSLPVSRFGSVARRLVPILRVPGIEISVGPPFRWYPLDLPTARAASAPAGFVLTFALPAPLTGSEGGGPSFGADSSLAIPRPGRPIPPGTGPARPGGDKGSGDSSPDRKLGGKRGTDNSGDGKGKHRVVRPGHGHEKGHDRQHRGNSGGHGKDKSEGHGSGKKKKKHHH